MGRSRLGCNIHGFTRTEWVWHVFTGFLSWFLDGLDFQQTWQGEFTNSTFFDVTLDQYRQLVHNSVHVFTGQTSVLNNLVNDLSLGVLVRDSCGFTCWSSFGGSSFRGGCFFRSSCFLSWCFCFSGCCCFSRCFFSWGFLCCYCFFGRCFTCGHIWILMMVVVPVCLSRARASAPSEIKGPVDF